MYQPDGTEPSNVYMYDSGTAIEVYPSSRIQGGECVDSAYGQLDISTLAWGGTFSFEPAYRTYSGLSQWRGSAYIGGSEWTKPTVTSNQYFDAFVLSLDSESELTGNLVFGAMGLTGDWPTHNIHSFEWTSYDEGTPVGTQTLHLNMFLPAWQAGGFGRTANFGMMSDGDGGLQWDGSDLIAITANGLDFAPAPIVCSYGGEIITGERTVTISSVTDTQVYFSDGGDPSATYNVVLDDSESCKYLRFYKKHTGQGLQVFYDYRVADYGQTAPDYLKQCRIRLGITRHDYGPGTEAIVTSCAYDTKSNDYAYRYWQPFQGLIHFSDDPADQDDYVIVAGESITITIHKDIT